MRLSFITQEEQIKLEQLFLSAVGEEYVMTGSKARDILLRSKLSPNYLSQIWSICDTGNLGKLHFPQFALAMYLCVQKIRGKEIPDQMPEGIMAEIRSMLQMINPFVVDSQYIPSW